MSSDATILEGIGEYKYGFRDPELLVFKARKGLKSGSRRKNLSNER